jgi:hypothetical protein
MDDWILEKLSPEQRNQLLAGIQQFECINSFEGLFRDDPVIIIAVLARFSYLARSPADTEKWVRIRFEEDDIEKEVLNEVMSCCLRYEVDGWIIPACDNLEKRGAPMTQIQRLYTTSVSRVAGIRF